MAFLGARKDRRIRQNFAVVGGASVKSNVLVCCSAVRKHPPHRFKLALNLSICEGFGATWFAGGMTKLSA